MAKLYVNLTFSIDGDSLFIVTDEWHDDPEHCVNLALSPAWPKIP